MIAFLFPFNFCCRHVGYVELKTPASVSGSSSSSTTTPAAARATIRSFSELVQSDAVTMQFMCVTHAQRTALPPEVKERITLHQVRYG